MKKDTRNKVVAASAVAVILLLLLKKKKSKDRTIRAVAVLPEGVQVFYTDDTDEIFGKNSIPGSVKTFVDGGGTVYHLSGEPLPPIDTDSAIGGVGAADKADFINFINRSLTDKKYKRRFEISVNENQKKNVERILGKRIDDFYVSSDDIRHSFNRHKKDTVQLKEEDLFMIPYIINYGNVFPEIYTKGVAELGARFEMTITGAKTNVIMISFVVSLDKEVLNMKTCYKTE